MEARPMAKTRPKARYDQETSLGMATRAKSAEGFTKVPFGY
jgi:hypothetical protein